MPVKVKSSTLSEMRTNWCLIVIYN